MLRITSSEVEEDLDLLAWLLLLFLLLDPLLLDFPLEEFFVEFFLDSGLQSEDFEDVEAD